jgi:hypothetical protein
LAYLDVMLGSQGRANCRSLAEVLFVQVLFAQLLFAQVRFEVFTILKSMRLRGRGCAGP